MPWIVKSLVQQGRYIGRQTRSFSATPPVSNGAADTFVTVLSRAAIGLPLGYCLGYLLCGNNVPKLEEQKTEESLRKRGEYYERSEKNLTEMLSYYQKKLSSSGKP